MKKYLPIHITGWTVVQAMC